MSIEKKKTLLQFNVFTLMEFDLYKVLTNVKQEKKEYITFYTTGLIIALRGF